MIDLYELSKIMSGINQGIEGLILFACLVVGVIALVQCFFGYKLIRIWIALLGSVIGGLIGAVMGVLSDGASMLVVFMLIGMVLGGFLAYKVCMLGVFYVGFMGGALIGTGLGILLDMQTGSIGSGCIGMAFIVGMVCGVCSLLLAKPVIIVLTVLPAVVELAGISSIVFKSTEIGIFLGLLFAIGGIWFQFKDNKKVQAEQKTS